MEAVGAPHGNVWTSQPQGDSAVAAACLACLKTRLPQARVVFAVVPSRWRCCCSWHLRPKPQAHACGRTFVVATCLDFVHEELEEGGSQLGRAVQQALVENEAGAGRVKRLRGMSHEMTSAHGNPVVSWPCAVNSQRTIHASLSSHHRRRP